MRKNCSSCGTRIRPTSNFCAHCGDRIETANVKGDDSKKPESPKERPSWREGVWMAETSEDPSAESQRKPQSWREWYEWRIENLGEFLHNPRARRRWTWRDWTWRDWAVTVGSIVALLIVIGIVTYEEQSPSYDCRREVKREMLFLIEFGLSNPEAMEEVDGPRFLGPFTEAGNEYTATLTFMYPNQFGAMRKWTARGVTTYESGGTCEFRLVDVEQNEGL